MDQQLAYVSTSFLQQTNENCYPHKTWEVEMRSFYKWNVWLLTHRTSTTGYWSYDRSRYDIWKYPIEWSWTWNEKIPHILHNWPRFTKYLQEGK